MDLYKTQMMRYSVSYGKVFVCFTTNSEYITLYRSLHLVLHQLLTYITNEKQLPKSICVYKSKQREQLTLESKSYKSCLVPQETLNNEEVFEYVAECTLSAYVLKQFKQMRFIYDGRISTNVPLDKKHFYTSSLASQLHAIITLDEVDRTWLICSMMCATDSSFRLHFDPKDHTMFFSRMLHGVAQILHTRGTTQHTSSLARDFIATARLKNAPIVIVPKEFEEFALDGYEKVENRDGVHYIRISERDPTHGKNHYILSQRKDQ